MIMASVSEFETTKSLIKRLLKKYLLFVLSINSGKYSLQKVWIATNSILFIRSANIDAIHTKCKFVVNIQSNLIYQVTNLKFWKKCEGVLDVSLLIL